MFEGTGKYFLLILLILVIVYITKKICFYYIFKVAKEQPYKAFIPIYTTKVLVDLLNMKKSVFYLCLIPGVNLIYYHQIYKQLLLGFGQDEKEAIWFDLIPMYKFPELVFKKPRFILNEYDLTSTFIENQQSLFESSQDKLPDKIELVNLSNKVDEYYDQKGNNNAVVEPIKYEQLPGVNNMSNFDNAGNNGNQQKIADIPLQNNNLLNVANTSSATANVNNVSNVIQDSFNQGDSVFTNKNLEPDERQETIVIAEKKQTEEKKPVEQYNEERLQMCPNCGAKLSAGATMCFMCGTKLK